MTTAKALEFFSRSGLPKPVTEYAFHPERGWRFDFAWPEYKLALEVDGGVYTGGRHVQPQGFLKDKEKFNNAAPLGWRILYCTPRSLVSFGMAELIKKSIAYQDHE